MKKTIIALAALPLMAAAASSTPKGFTDNLDEALERAKSNGRYLYVCFSGSDWCGWCIKLEKEVLSKPAFLRAVTNDYELVYIDSPNDKSLLSEHAKEKNPGLVEKYNVSGFPTALILDSNGDTLAQTGYQRGGPKKYAKYLKSIREKGPMLKIENELAKQHITPFEDEIKKIMLEDVIKPLNAAMKGVEGEEAQKAKSMELAKTLIPQILPKIETAVAKFKASETPKGLEERKAKAIKEVEDLVTSLKKQLDK